MSQWWFRAILSGGMLFALGCAAQSTNIQTAASTDPQIRLHVDTQPEGVQLVIDGDTPLVYTAFRLPDPPRLILDLAGVSLEPGQQSIQVDHGAVTTIQPTAGTAGSHNTRIEVGLTQLVDYQLRPNGNKLQVTIAAPSTAGTPINTADASPSAPSIAGTSPAAQQAPPAAASSSSVAEASAAPDATEPSERPTADHPMTSNSAMTSTAATTPEAPAPPSAPLMTLPDATAVTAIHINRGGPALVVAIEGNGQFHPQTMLLSGPRLVIDLPGASARLRPRIAVNEPLLKQIRIGTHQDPRKVRVVMDLAGSVTYEVTQEAGTLHVSLTSSTATPAGSPDAEGRRHSTATDSSHQPAPAAPNGVTEATTPAPNAAPIERAPASAVKPIGDARVKDVALPVPALPKKAMNVQMSSNGADKTGAPKTGDIGQKQFTGRLISLDFQDADLDNVLRLMADVSGMNIVVGEGVKGKVTVKLLNVPWDQALDLVLRTHGLGQAREGNILRIDTLNNLAKQQDDEAKAKDSATKAEDLITRVMYANYAEAKKLADALKKHMSPRGDITIDDRTNALIVKDINSSVQEILALLKVLDTKTPQILIEARVVSADTNFARDLGVAWGGSAKTTTGSNQFGVITGPTGDVFTGSQKTPAPGFLVNLPASGQAGPLGNLGFTLGRLTSNPLTLDLRLSAGETQGVSKTISAPKVLVLDNQKARIEQGTSVPFQTTSQQGTNTIFVSASLILEVTPHVTPDGSILMALTISNDEPDYAKVTDAGPPIKKKEAKTNIMVKDGDTVVLGGIYISTNSDSVSGLPWLRNIPIFGWLFKQTSKANSNNELLLFLTPKIVT